MRILHTTRPHGEHEVMLVEDNRRAAQRIYEISDLANGRIGLTGAELESMMEWWSAERKRAVP